MLHPEFERAEFCDGGLDLHRHDRSCRSVGESRKLDLQQAGFFQFAFGIGQHLARRITAAHRGREEPEISGLAGHKTKCATLDQQVGSLLHALWHDAERLDRWAEAGDGGHRCFQPDVVAA